MDASDLLRRNFQVTNASAKVAAVKVNRPAFVANTVNNITNVSTMTFASAEDKMTFDAGIQYLKYTAGVPTLSTMSFCGARS
jgi:hypothetical protein